MKDEFSLIKSILDISKDAVNTPDIIVPPGDDAALLKKIARPVISTDTQRENVHFKLDWASPEEIGFKAVTVTLSDLAASYAAPLSLFINLAVPDYISDGYVDSLYSGINKALKTYNCSLGGGNISSAAELSLDLFAVGNGDPDIFPLRSEAKQGHGLYVTGPIGVARAGLDALSSGQFDEQEVIRHFRNPVARFDASKILRSYNVACVMDISDGLSGDAEQMAAASEISIEFTVEKNDLPDSLVRYCEKNNLPPVDFAIAGGEDYELLFTCPESTFAEIKKELPDSFKVGNCLAFCETHIVNPPDHIQSYRHR